jgi:aspartyl-tRNA(Asn)/glutamyl-tRNA(Gln) amidotransferase subunit A
MRVHEMTAIDLARAYAARDLAPKEVIDSLLMRIAASDMTINAVLGSDTDAARQAANASGWRYRRGHPLSVLDGVPLLVKDNIDTAHLRTTYGSALFREHVPSDDAHVVRIARDRGLIILAKTNLNEFAWGISGANPHYGAVRNPRDPTLIAGGSSGGSAAGVAQGYAPLALGTDTGGSARIPAAYCGVTGLKPSYGLLPVGGTFPLAQSLDHVGLLGRSASDVRTLLTELTSGPATRDAPTRFRIGVAGFDRLPPADETAGYTVLARWSERAQHTLRPVGLPRLDEAFGAFRILQAVEALDNHRRRGLYPEYAAQYAPDVRARLKAAEDITVAEIRIAAEARRGIRSLMTRVFREVDIVVTPTVQLGPWAVDEKFNSAQDAERRRQAMAFMVPWNLTGLPACVLPMPRSSGLAASLQLVGRLGTDEVLLGAADALEREIAAIHDQFGPGHEP